MSTPSRRRSLRALEDPELMAEVGAGRAEAFAELYDRYCDRAYRVALAVCREEALAQDAVRAAFLSIWKHRAGHDPRPGTVAAWLLSSVRSRAIDSARADEDAAEPTTQRDEADRLHDSLGLLPEAEQEVITLAYYGQLSHAEIATQLDLPPGTVKGRMRLGLKELQSALERERA